MPCNVFGGDCSATAAPTDEASNCHQEVGKARAGNVLGLAIGTNLKSTGAGVMQANVGGANCGAGTFAEVVMVKGTITSQNRTDMNAWLKYNNGL